MERRLRGGDLALLVAYLSTIPAANWLIGHLGTVCVARGPCLIPVAPGLMAPSGVLMAGLALVLRDAVQRRAGRAVAVAAVLAGAALSWLVASPALAFASAAAFCLSEFADAAVFTPLQRRGLVLAVLAGGLVGAVIDSAAFLFLAFGNLDFLAGQVVGKLWAVLAGLPLVRLMRRATA